MIQESGIIMVFTSAMIPFCIFTIRNFVISVPVELDEAAVIDGAGPLSLFFKVIHASFEANYGDMFYSSVYGSME